MARLAARPFSYTILISASSSDLFYNVIYPADVSVTNGDNDQRVFLPVDSANVGTTYGAVREGHEVQSGAYNNISGPVVPASAVPLSAPTAPAQKQDQRLPARPQPR